MKEFFETVQDALKSANKPVPLQISGEDSAEKKLKKVTQELDRQVAKGDLLVEMSRHLGEARPISMKRLTEIIFQKRCDDPYNEVEARWVRRMINELRWGTAGVPPMPIASKCCHIAGGYFLATGNQLEAYIKRIERRHLKGLTLAARLRNLTLPEELGQLTLGLESREEV